MNITELSVRRPTAVVVFFIILIGLGAMGYFNMGADLFPQANTPIVSIHATYPGAGAEEIETDLVKPIEDAVSGLPGIDKVRSVSMEGFGYTILQFSMSTKTDSAVLDVQKAVDGIMDSLPGDATRPVVRKFDINADPMLVLAMSGNTAYEELRARAEDFKRRLENVAGVGKVDLVGAPERELDVTVDKTATDAYGIGLPSILAALKSDNLKLPAGLLRQAGIDRPVRVEGEFVSLADVRGLKVPLPRGGTVALGELAQVGFAYPEDSHKARLNAAPSVGILVTKTSDANVVETAARVKASLDTERRLLPAGMDLKIASDATIFIEASLSETSRDILLGILATSVVLFVFLKKWRSSLIVLVAIPTSLIATFFMMYMSGFTLNILSVMALALCIGILVDDSIVVLENIHRHRSLGEDRVSAAISGRMEIGLAAIAITLCDVVVFAPVAFMGDLVGQFFRQFGLTVVFASLFSLLVSFTLTPAMASRFLEDEDGKVAGKPRGRFEAFFETRIIGGYRRLLECCLAHRWPVLGIVLSLFLASLSLVPLKLIQTEFMPPFDQGKLIIDLNLGAGADLARTESAAVLLETHLRSLGEVADVFSQIGTTGGGTSAANLVVRLKDKTDRAKTQALVAKELRSWCAGLPSASVSVSEPAIVAQTSIEGKKSLILNVTGPDRAVLARIANRIETSMRSIPGAVDVENSTNSRQTTIGVGLDRLALSEYGLTASDAALALRTALSGTKAGVYRKAGSEYDIVVRLMADQMRKPADIGALRLQGRSGAMVPLDQVAVVTREDSASSLERRNRSNVVTLQANLEGRPLGAVTAELKAALASGPLPAGYGYAFSGDVSNMSSSFGSLAWALAASIGLVYLILVALYESYLTPLIRMLSLPAGIIGGLGALALAGKAINIVSFIGIIMLDGLISKNGTLLIDYTHTLMKRGLSLRDSLLEAATTRLRPILMTSFTMIAGMLPLALSGGSSSEIKSGMAIVLIGGLATSTLITPLLLPVAYTLIEEARSRRRSQGRAGPRPGRPGQRPLHRGAKPREAVAGEPAHGAAATDTGTGALS